MSLQVLESALLVLSVVLPVVGVWRGYRAVSRDLNQRAAVWRRWEVLQREHPDDHKKASQVLEREYPPRSSWHDLTYLRELIAYLVISDKVAGLRGDVVLVLAGLAAGLAAGLIGVWR